MIFNYSKWVAKEVTGPKNIDKKIFVVGPAGSGKSMTGLRLAQSISKWVSYYNQGDFYGYEKYFKLDKDHLAVIDTNDLIHVMTVPLPKNSIKVVDDCGASVGFTSRRAMSKENLDLASVYGTNRVRNSVTIYCVQDTNFTDIRMRKLANEIIDLNDYYQKGPFRMARLWRLRMDEKAKSGIKKCRFMTYEHGVWVTQERLACFMPDGKEREEYDKIRDQKEKENSELINKKYTQMVQQKEAINNKPKCPHCGSTKLYFSKRQDSTKCNGCGRYF